MRTMNATKYQEYSVWQNMKARCYRVKRPDFKHYGGRGIKVCERWLHSFENFYEDIGPRPGGFTAGGMPEYWLERENNTKDYAPDNCYWATIHDQQRNKRDSLILEVDGVSRCLADWATEVDVSMQLIGDRLRLGWGTREAIFTPAQTNSNRRGTIYLTIYGKTMPMARWSEISGIRYHTAHNRYKQGFSDKEIIFGRPGVSKL